MGRASTNTTSSGICHLAILAPSTSRISALVGSAPGANPTKAEILDVLGAKIAKWQMPDDVVFVDALPMTATGKISKKDLRAKFSDYKLPD